MLILIEYIAYFYCEFVWIKMMTEVLLQMTYVLNKTTYVVIVGIYV